MSKEQINEKKLTKYDKKFLEEIRIAAEIVMIEDKKLMEELAKY